MYSRTWVPWMRSIKDSANRAKYKRKTSFSFAFPRCSLSWTRSVKGTIKWVEYKKKTHFSFCIPHIISASKPYHFPLADNILLPHLYIPYVQNVTRTAQQFQWIYPAISMNLQTNFNEFTQQIKLNCSANQFVFLGKSICFPRQINLFCWEKYLSYRCKPLYFILLHTIGNTLANSI